uniref:Uncharacterized protein n=1 Tax=Meloidogyne enterolobii TaxID=390850 RepID=A0A6V7Y4W5_MELEN|nr:unnamed protein product [Meloidogyne enterolobii]
MIGLGSMYGHLDHFDYDDNEIAKTERKILIEKLDNNYKKKYLKSSQITAIYQFALGLLVIEHFNKINNRKFEGIEKIMATFEDMHLNIEYERKYLREKYNIFGIKPENKQKNLKKFHNLLVN